PLRRRPALLRIIEAVRSRAPFSRSAGFAARRAALLSNDPPMNEKSNRIIVTVIGADRVGIIAGVSAVLAEANANIVDISQTTLQEFFTMILMADVGQASIPFDELKRRLADKGNEMGVKIDAQHEDVFKY